MTRTKSFGQPTGRLAQLIVETAIPEPYEVTDKITVDPPTKARSQALTDALTAMGITNSLMQQALRIGGPARPDYPAMPQPPQGETTPETLEAYQSAISAHEGLMVEWETLHSKWEADVEKLESTMSELAEQMTKHGDDYSKALFGPAHDDVMAYFADQPVELWNAFVEDIKDQFGLSPKPSQVPDDGKCASCGHVTDEEQAGKAPESSTS